MKLSDKKQKCLRTCVKITITLQNSSNLAISDRRKTWEVPFCSNAYIRPTKSIWHHFKSWYFSTFWFWLAHFSARFLASWIIRLVNRGSTLFVETCPKPNYAKRTVPISTRAAFLLAPTKERSTILQIIYYSYKTLSNNAIYNAIL